MKLWIDIKQGNDKSGAAFGYVGGDDPSRGIFFTWPSEYPRPLNRAETAQLVASMEYEASDTAGGGPAIPWRRAERMIRRAVHKVATLVA